MLTCEPKKIYEVLSIILDETYIDTKENKLINTLRCLIDEKLIPAIEVIGYENKYSIIGEIEKILLEIEYLCFHKELINCEVVGFFEPEKNTMNMLHKYLIDSEVKQNVLGMDGITDRIRKNPEEIFPKSIPMVLHGYSDKQGVYIDTVSTRECEVDFEKYIQLLAFLDGNEKSILNNVSLYSKKIKSKAIAILPNMSEGKDEELYSRINSLWINAKKIDDKLFEEFQSLETIYVYGEITTKNRKFVDQRGVENDIKVVFVNSLGTEIEGSLLKESKENRNNISQFGYGMENLLMEVAWYLAKQSSELYQPFKQINEEMVYNPKGSIYSYLTQLKESANKEIKEIRNIYNEYKVIADDIMDKVKELQNCLCKEEKNKTFVNEAILARIMFDLVIKLNLIYKNFPENNCKQILRQHCDLYRKVSQNEMAYKYLVYDFQGDKSGYKKEELKDIVNLPYKSQVLYHSIFQNSKMLDLDYCKIGEIGGKIRHKTAYEYNEMADYYYMENQLKKARKYYLKSLYYGCLDAGKSLCLNYELSEDELESLAEYGVVTAAEICGIKLYDSMKGSKEDVKGKKWQQCKKYLLMAAAQKSSKALKVLGSIYYDQEQERIKNILYQMSSDNYKSIDIVSNDEKRVIENIIYYYTEAKKNGDQAREIRDRVMVLLFVLQKYNACMRWGEENKTSECYYYLGKIYEVGLGIASDKEKALECYKKALGEKNIKAFRAYQKLNR